jgi:hypothetical protein
MTDTAIKKSVAGLMALLCLLAWSPWAQSADERAATQFLRFLEGDGDYAGELQTSVTSYRNEQGIEVDLVATVHIADRPYYQGLNDYFTTRDAVLYELVADENVRPNGQGSGRGSGVIGFLQTSLTRLLGLSYQLNVINYARPNFFHADLEPQELDAVMDAKGETLFSSILSLVLTEIEQQERSLPGERDAVAQMTFSDIMRLFSLPNRQDAFKYLLGQSLAESEDSLASLTGRGITILDDRNEAALDVLRRGLTNPSIRSFSIFYGAAHMPGIEQGLGELGFSRSSQTWLTAWKTD